MSTVEGPTSKTTQQRFEDLSSSYRFECSQGIPASVRERYELRLKWLREELRSRKTSCYLGDVLRRIGAIDEEQLASALSLQMANGRKRLLGEILVDLGWVDEGTIRRAVEEQIDSRRVVHGVPARPSH